MFRRNGDDSFESDLKKDQKKRNILFITAFAIIFLVVINLIMYFLTKL